MKVHFGQIYTEVDANFPFSHRMQVWLSKKLSPLATPAPGFVAKYGTDFALMVRINGQTGQPGNAPLFSLVSRLPLVHERVRLRSGPRYRAAQMGPMRPVCLESMTPEPGTSQHALGL